jgi:DNA polymerase-3 subunit delta'
LADLRRSLKTGRLNHAYLFIGPNGVGKNVVALALAKAALCLEGGDRAPCGECRSCRVFDSGNHPDFHRIGQDGESIKIERIREVSREAGYHPVLSDRKIYLLEQMQLLTEVAANGFLKTLEEPPSYVHFLATTENEKDVLPTIRSRFQLVRLTPIPVEIISEELVKRGCSAERARQLAIGSRGLPGRALAGLQEEAEDTVDWSSLFEAGDILSLMKKAGEAEKASRSEVENWLDEWTGIFRNKLRDRDQVNNLNSILASLEAICLSQKRLAANVNIRLLLEGLFLRLYTIKTLDKQGR